MRIRTWKRIKAFLTHIVLDSKVGVCKSELCSVHVSNISVRGNISSHRGAEQRANSRHVIKDRGQRVLGVDLNSDSLL